MSSRQPNTAILFFITVKNFIFVFVFSDKSISNLSLYDEAVVLKHLHHYLPHQKPLKDFVHHNTLHSFQDIPFHQALEKASVLFGYQTYLPLTEFRKLFAEGKISELVLTRVLQKHKKEEWKIWQQKLLYTEYNTHLNHRLGQLRRIWDKKYNLNIDKQTVGFLFRFVSAYIDQGISIKKFPVTQKSFLSAIRELEKHSFVKIFRSKRVSELLFERELNTKKLLDILVGEEKYYEQYLFEQQFVHPGWSGMVAVLEKHPDSLLDKRKISLKHFIIFELLLEIDILDYKIGQNKWKNIKYFLKNDSSIQIEPLFAPVEHKELFDVYALWQEAYEWTLYDQVLKGLQIVPSQVNVNRNFRQFFV